ncbi:MAG: hypothetical protein M3389_13605 [Actinomycetota bacterium]|nr:hypothetical protein [Actinomycetota bacterium]
MKRIRFLLPILALCAVAAVLATRDFGDEPEPVRGASAPAIRVSAPVHPPPMPQPPDSDAPKGAPPHWIPSEEWVMQHWLPFDEDRLLRLLGITRAELWRHLRDDRRTLSTLAARHGWPQPKRLAAALVAPRRLDERASVTKRELEARALRTLTQGHMAQHVLFHTLHQDAVPDQAREVFGVSSINEFQRLRRLDVSPLQIARMNGLSRASVQRLGARALRERAAAGVRRGELSARQSEVLVARQLRQFPRWLSESHYNGPPRTDRTGRLLEPPVPAWAAPSLTGDGREVIMEAYEPKLKLALERGEISVMSAGEAGQAKPVSHGGRSHATGPVSAYNPVVSADGRVVAYEVSAGNQNFAKRYGDTTVVVQNRRTGKARAIGVQSGTAYAPALSGDGSVVAVQVAEDGPDADTRVYVGSVAGNDLRPLPRPPAIAGVRAGVDSYEPSLSGDGRRVAYVAFARGRGGTTSQVYVHDVETGRTVLASRADGRDGAAAAGESWAPRLSADGRQVVFAAAARNLGGRRPARGESRIYIRDLDAGTTRLVSADNEGTPLRGFASDPSPSADGATVAFSLAPPGSLRTARGKGRPPQAVLVRELADGGVERVAAAARGYAGAPSLSADGQHVAFAGDEGERVLRVYVRDRSRGQTRAARAPTSVPATTAPAATRLCRLRPPVW